MKYANNPMQAAHSPNNISLIMHPIGQQQQHAKNQPADAIRATPTKKMGYLVHSGIDDSAETIAGRIVQSSKKRVCLPHPRRQSISS